MAVSLSMLLIAFFVVVGAVLLAIVFGGPRWPPALDSINEPFERARADFLHLPPVRRFVARDGAFLAYRAYSPVGATERGSVILIHGSAAAGGTMHVMADEFARAGYSAFALDLRGHGDSCAKGQIDYIGQLEDDLEDFCHSVPIPGPRTLVGFSAGGGFALRVSASPRQEFFSNYLLLAPLLSWRSPTLRPGGGGWVRVGRIRLVAIALLNVIGIRRFNTLAVIRFALNDLAKTFLTPQYSFDLTLDFMAKTDYQANLRAVTKPLELIVGEDDEIFFAERFRDEIRAAGCRNPVTIVPSASHVTLTLDEAPIRAAIDSVDRMNGTGTAQQSVAGIEEPRSLTSIDS